ncbi:MAG: hypothetical protein LBU03_04315 [Tannerellaceae bacterium]|jgi:hypothetical protein|nr:hypothetical protein [Tannerellaceae bacterium]
MYTKLISASLLVLFLFTSCLDTSHRSGSGSAIGVVRYNQETGKKLIYTNVGVLYSTTIETACKDSDCVVFAYAYDYGIPENANSTQTGYLFVSVGQKPVVVDKADVFFEGTDTTILFPGEISLLNPVTQTDNPLCFNYVAGHLFLSSTFTGSEKQEIRWQLFCDTIQTPYKENGEEVYTLYLRALNLDPEEEGNDSVSSLNAYYLGDFSHPFRIAYLSAIDDAWQPTWLFSPVIH